MKHLKEKDLHSFPQINDSQMIQLFENWIFFTSKFYCEKNTIQPYELADLRQFIKIRLLEQLPKIKNNYKGESTLRTYISAIVLNLCKEFRRKNCSKSILTQIEITKSLNYHSIGLSEGENSIALKREITNLNKVILMYGGKSSKVNLTLKMYYGIQTTENDLLKYCNDDKILTLDLLKRCQSEKQLNKKESLTILTELFNLVEGKSNSTEATRKWISRLIDDILSILNLGQSSHTKETLGFLLETSLIK